ncbi:MAG: type II toxin-antitoxin system HicB family antitoxin [Rhodothermales bacterium]
MTQVPVVLEHARRNWSAFVPDLPGCVATGRSLEAVLANIKEAIQFHLDGMAEDGAAIPEAFAAPFRLDVQIAGE